jgi:hypothetical protein
MRLFSLFELFLAVFAFYAFFEFRGEMKISVPWLCLALMFLFEMLKQKGIKGSSENPPA